MRRVLIVGCGFPQLSLIRTAKRLGLYVIGADANPRAVAVQHCDEFVRVSTSDVSGLGHAVRACNADAMTTTGSELALRTAAQVAVQVGLPFYVDPDTVRRCQDKDVMRAAYAAAGLAGPSFAQCESFHQAVSFARSQGFPLVVKPSRGWGQRGIARVEGEEDLRQAFDDAHAHSASAGLACVVVERWLVGREYSVNGWMADGRHESHCVTERITRPGNKPLGVMIAEVYPSGLTPTDEARVIEEASRGAAALGHVRGPCYSQVALGPSGCVLFETAARLGGGFDADVTRLASGVDLYERVLGIALGDAELERSGARSIGLDRDRGHNAAVVKFLVATPGVVTAVTGLEAARRLDGIDDADVFVPVGGRVMPLTDSAKRAAYVLAYGTTREEALGRADAALGQIRIHTQKESLLEAAG